MKSEIFSSEILSIILVGSTARGDNDSYSDTDILVVCDDVNFERLIEIKTEVSDQYSSRFSNLEVSIFSLPVISKMLACGSMFLRHVKCEGEILLDRENRFCKLLQTLADFQRFDDELKVYESVVRQIRFYNEPNEFDLHLMQMIVRNICIMLTYTLGNVDFGRSSSFGRVKSNWPSFPMNNLLFEEMTKWHIAYAKGGDSSLALPSRAEFISIVQEVEKCIVFCKKVTK